MTKHNATNERIKRKYFGYLKDAKRHSEMTIDAAAKALNRFEVYTKHRDFKSFHIEQAGAFKRHLAEQPCAMSGAKLSKATLYATLTQLKRFFQWLSDKPGYKSRFQYSDADYFNPSDKESRIATARREQRAPTLEQVNHVLKVMPTDSEIERRNRALIAFTVLTGARDSAIASMKLKHVDLVGGRVDQDAREVNTKFSKTFETFFFPVGAETWNIVAGWITYLREKKYGAVTTRCFPLRELQSARLASLRWTASNGRIGAPQHRSAKYFAKHSSRLDCRISTPIASETHSSNLV
jgi:site-specific recombinase XerD